MKYKIGEKVKISSCMYGHEFKIGEIVTIKSAFPQSKQPYYDAISESGKGWSIDDCEIEPIKETLSSVYVLQRDLPDLKAGAELNKEGEKYYYVSTNNRNSSYHESHVENNPDWFLPKKEEPKEFTESDLRHFVDKYKNHDAKKIDQWVTEFIEEKRKNLI